jgi:hypothetical protein
MVLLVSLLPGNGRADRPIFGLLWRANEAVLPVIQRLWILNARDER